MVLTVMNIKQKIAVFFVSVGLLSTATAAFIVPNSANAQCGAADTAIIKCNASQDPKTAEETGLWQVLLMAVNILTGLAGLAALGGVIYGAVLYTSAGGSQEQVKKAMGIFTNVAIGVIAFAIMYAALNFLIPGGAF
jgi:hypothetical protein